MNKSLSTLIIDLKIISEPVVIKDFGLEKILEVKGEFVRTSGKKDIFIINYSDGLSNQPEIGNYYNINGSLRNIMILGEDSKYSYSKVYILAKNFSILDGEPEIYTNEIKLFNVELFYKSVVRKSFKDESIDITDIKVKVQRNIEKYNIFKCTCWNNNARLISSVDKGSLIDIIGRLQSKFVNEDGIRTEISVSSISISDDVEHINNVSEEKGEPELNATGSKKEERS